MGKKRRYESIAGLVYTLKFENEKEREMRWPLPKVKKVRPSIKIRWEEKKKAEEKRKGEKEMLSDVSGCTSAPIGTS